MARETHSIAKEGYLIKESLHFKFLRKRWVVLSPKGYLDCYKDDALLVPTETLDLYTFYDVGVSYEKGSKRHQFEIYSNHAYQADRIFIAASAEDMNDWIKQIKCSMEQKKTKTITIQTYTEAVSRIDKLKNELNEIKHKHSKEMQTKLKQLAKSKDKQHNELKAYIRKLEKEFFSLQNEMAQDIDAKDSNHTQPITAPSRPQRGLLIFQNDAVTNKQLLDITKYYQSNMDNAPMFVCGDNDSIANQSIVCPITTYFYAKDDIPTLFAYKTLINKQFKQLSEHLMNGNDVIIQLNTSNTQIIYHKIGIETDGTKLPFSFIEYIQHKIDELTKYAHSTQVVKCYTYNKTQYKSAALRYKTEMKTVKLKTKKSNRAKYKNANKKRTTSSTSFTSNRTTKSYKKEKQAAAASVACDDYNSYSNGDVKAESKANANVGAGVDCVGAVWQWRNNKNKWISYDDNTQSAIESLAINGIYEYATNSFIAKITKTSGVHVNVSNESKREIRRVKSYKTKDIAANIKTTASKTKRKTKTKHKVKGKLAARFAHLNIDPMKLKVGATPPKRKRANPVKEDLNNFNSDDSLLLDKESMSPISPMVSPQMKYSEKGLSGHMDGHGINMKSMTVWQWKNDNNRWHSYPKRISNKIEHLEMGQSYQYTLNQKTFKITKHSTNWAIQIDVQTLKKRNIRQTIKTINVNTIEI